MVDSRNFLDGKISYPDYFIHRIDLYPKQAIGACYKIKRDISAAVVISLLHLKNFHRLVTF